MENETWIKYLQILPKIFYEGYITKKTRSGNSLLVNEAGWTRIVRLIPNFDFAKIKNKYSTKIHTVITTEKTSE